MVRPISLSPSRTTIVGMLRTRYCEAIAGSLSMSIGVMIALASAQLSTFSSTQVSAFIFLQGGHHVAVK